MSSVGRAILLSLPSGTFAQALATLGLLAAGLGALAAVIDLMPRVLSLSAGGSIDVSVAVLGGLIMLLGLAISGLAALIALAATT